MRKCIVEEKNIKKPKISVIIPVYNVEKYLAQCLDSVVSQPFDDIELIIVNNCSKDNTIKIAEEYAKNDKRIKIINHEINRGLAVSRNTGLENAQGDYIFFLDSDDYLLPDILDKLYKNILKTHASLVVCRAEAFADDEKDKALIKKTERMNNWLNRSGEGVEQIEPDTFENFLEKTPTVAWNKLYSKDFLQKNEIFFIKSNTKFEDNGFQIKIFSNMPTISYLEDVGVMYRMRKSADSFTTKNRENYKNTRKILEDAFEYIKNTCDETLAKKLIETIRNSRSYSKFFGIKTFGFEFLWTKKNKKISILGIPFFRQKIKGNCLITRFLNIEISKAVEV